MDKEGFVKSLREHIMILDCAKENELMKVGMPVGACVPVWAEDYSEAFIEVQRKYVKAGSHVILTNTAKANGFYLQQYGFCGDVRKLNKELALITRRASMNKTMVAGDIGATGKAIWPLGDEPFESTVDMYKLQIAGLIDGGVDFLVIDGMTDIQEARAALIAAKESCDLPVCVTMEFLEIGAAQAGIDPLTALITIQSLGADAFGCCLKKPVQISNVLKKLKSHAKIPLILKMDAGYKGIIEGKRMYDLPPEIFSEYAKMFCEAGINIVGGFGGTTQDHIEKTVENLTKVKPGLWFADGKSAVTSWAGSVFIGHEMPLVIVGGEVGTQKFLSSNIESMDGNSEVHKIVEMAASQVNKGANIINIRISSETKEQEVLINTKMKAVLLTVNAPLCFESMDPIAIEKILRIYPGRALIHYISGEESSMEKLLPLASQYGAMFILKPIEENEVLEGLDQRIRIVEKVFNRAKKYGFKKKDFVVDAMLMPSEKGKNSFAETLRLIEWCTSKFGCASVIGLPDYFEECEDEKFLNSAYLAMANGKGLTMAMANPAENTLMNIVKACDVLLASVER